VSINGSLILPDVIEESRRLSAALEAEGIPVRLLGGLGILLVAAGAYPPELAREYNDIDLVTDSRHGRQLARSLAEQGYEPNQMFNRMHGARRLMFYDEPNERQVDVFVGSFEMCHTLPIAERMDVVPLTLPAADLLLTKLQIVKLNEKDRNDAYALLLALDVGSQDDGAINAAWVASLCARDWGLYRTLQLNIEKLRDGVAGVPVDETQRNLIAQRLAAIQRAVEDEPKGSKWKLRARVGDKIRWYDDPEEVERHGY
jgi:hypothetical protein